MSRGGLYLAAASRRRFAQVANRCIPRCLFQQGRMRPLLEAMPVRVILNDRAALYAGLACGNNMKVGARAM